MKMARMFSILIMLVITLSIFSLPGVVLAQDGQQTTPPADNITISTQYPKIDGLATDTFQFNVEMNYMGATNRVFDLKATAPPDWSVTITPLYDTSKKISSISMESAITGTTQSIQVTAGFTNWPLPDPGEYTIKLEVASDNVVANMDLIARVTARYSLSADPSDKLYSVKVKSNHDNLFSIIVMNTGTAPIEDITFSSDKMQGWDVTYKPEKIDSLASLETKTIDVNIKPAAKTISGDYMLNVWITGKQASADKMAIRVTVETPTIWGWVGVIIIIIVVVGLIAIFMRFGRR
jgi:uncharacterized membrane protein